MKINARISLFVNRDGTTLEIEDEGSNTIFFKTNITPEQLSAMLSRQGHVLCEESEVFNVGKIGKKHECKDFTFEIPEILSNSKFSYELKNLANSLLEDGWRADSYFGSQKTFSQKDGKRYATCTIRRYV